MGYQKGFDFGDGQWRDVFHGGDCDARVRQLCQHLGWLEELEALVGGGDEGAEVVVVGDEDTGDAVAAAAGVVT